MNIKAEARIMTSLLKNAVAVVEIAAFMILCGLNRDIHLLKNR